MGGFPGTVEFGNRVMALRKKAGFRNADVFADSIGISRGSYRSIERGEVKTHMAWAWALADAFSVSLDELVGRESPNRARKTSDDLARDKMLRAFDSMSREGKENAAAAVNALWQAEYNRGQSALRKSEGGKDQGEPYGDLAQAG